MTATRTPVTFAGTNINSGAFTAKFLIESGIGEVFESAAVSADVAREFGTLVRVQPQGRALSLRMQVVTDTYANIQTLKQLFNTRRGAQTLTATDDNSVTLRISAAPLRMTPVEGYHRLYDVLLWCETGVWSNDTENDATHTIDSTAETITAAHVTNDGNDDVRPRFVYTPATTGSTYKAASTSYNKQRHVALAVRAPLPHVDANGNGWPIDITGGGWDVETKIKANGLHPQGYDIRVFADGVEINRWLSNYGAGYGHGDTASTGRIRTYETTGGLAYHALKFRLPGCTAAETNTVDEVAFFLKRVNPGTALAGTMVCKIRSDSAGAPGSVVTNGTSNTVNASSVGTSAFAETSFTFAANPVLNAKTWYWLELSPASVTNMDNSNYIQIAQTPIYGTLGDISGYEGITVSHTYHSNDESSWSANDSGVGMHLNTDSLTTCAFRVYTSGTAKIWIAPELPARVKLTLASALQSGGDTTYRVSDVEGTARLPDRAALVIDSECMIVTKEPGTTDQLRIVKRGARGTTAAAHSVGATIYLSDIDPRIVYGYSLGTDVSNALGKGRYEPDELAPAINGVLSTNSQMRIIGPHFGFGSEVRPILFRAEQDDSVSNFDQVSLDGNLTNDLVNVTFKDAKPAGDYISRNAAVQVFPTGIESGSNKITVDVTPIPAALSLEHYLTNERGEEELVATHRNPDAGAGKTISPTSVGYRYRLLARNEAVTGCETADATDESIAGAAVSVQGGGESFILEEETTITGFAMRLKDSGGGGTFTATIKIIGWDESATGTYPEGEPDEGIVYAQSASMTQADTGTSYTTFTTTLATPVTLAAGKYAIAFITSAFATALTVYGSAGASAYGGGQSWELNTTTWTRNATSDIWFRIYGTPTQGNTPKNTGGTLDIDNFIIELDDTTPGTPFVNFQSSDQDCWLVDGVLSNSTTSQSVSVLAIMQAAETLDIDFDEFTATHSDDDLADQSYLVALSGFDEADPFKLAPGANTVVWTEAGLSGSITASLRTRFREAFL